MYRSAWGSGLGLTPSPRSQLHYHMTYHPLNSMWGFSMCSRGYIVLPYDSCTMVGAFYILVWTIQWPTMCHGFIAYELIPLHRSYGWPICPMAWWLGEFSFVNGSTVCTVMRLHTGVGFKHEFGACSCFNVQEVRFGEPETTSLKEENGRRPIFFNFWSIEVP